MFKNIERLLQEYAQEFAQLTKDKIEKNDHVASGELLGSIKTRVEDELYVYTVYLDSKEYLKYLETGTKPHYPPIAPLIKWVREKKSIATREKSGNKTLPTEKQVAYAVQKTIGKYGTKPRDIIASTEKELNDIYLPKLEEALNQDVTENLKLIQINLKFN